MQPTFISPLLLPCIITLAGQKTEKDCKVLTVEFTITIRFALTKPSFPYEEGIGTMEVFGKISISTNGLKLILNCKQCGTTSFAR